ncbi:lipid A deacylase LpxR family protein [Paraflavitalea pollutisoli]|uniref:lipid A deacylase LpxR family protein n=1 Tax=Paraflavitalea pollutisoli TaxID=3034143 RepID=UPI0023EB89CD|nr:lipid A deacylase LpxR family protein [Paraflavitalea sp. H1-2-19X]
MKRIYWRLWIGLQLLLPATLVKAQEAPVNRYLIRVYEDNDAMNLFDPGSDQGYTNGTRLDFFWVPRKRPFLAGLFPQAGPQSTNTHSWSLMHQMITPDNIVRRVPDREDFPYSGGLFITRGLHSANAHRRLALQSELLLGVMGPPAMAEGLQKLIHRVIAAQPPRGWDYQKPTDLLLNYNFSVSQQLSRPAPGFEFIGVGQAQVGTMQNSLAVSGLMRFGKMNPYFDGLIPQFSIDKRRANRWQLYFTVQPGIEWMITNALLDGGVFNDKPSKGAEAAGPYDVPITLERRKILGHLDLGAVLTHGNFGASFTQRSTTSMFKGIGGQGFGNVSVYIAW